MRKYIAGTILMMFSLLFVFVGTAGAAYDSSGDLKINLNTKLIPFKFSNKTGELSFTLQENLHDSLKDTTGVEIDHSYIWISVNGENISAIDPPKPLFN